MPYYTHCLALSVRNGCVLWGSRVVIPPQERGMLLKLLHQSHPGMSRMKGLARLYVWWPKMDHGVENEVSLFFLFLWVSPFGSRKCYALVLFHAVLRRGASLEWVESLTWSSCLDCRLPLGCAVADLCGLYLALSQDGKLVVEDIPLVVWGLCFGKVGGVYILPVWLCPVVSLDGATVSSDPFCLSLQYLCAVVYVSGG